MKMAWLKWMFVVAGIALLAAPAWADEPDQQPNSGALGFTMTLNFPTAYYFRGIAQSNAGFEFQPYLELKATVFQGGEKDILSGAFLKVAGFAHFNSVAPPIQTNYYEQDLYLSAGVSLVKRLTLEGGWNLYAYPGIGSSAQVQEVFGKVSFDDAGLWPLRLPGGQDLALSPYVLVAGETSGAADGAAPFGGSRGVYMEFGLDPGYTVELTDRWSVRLHLPFVLGLSLDNYYQVATTSGLKDKTFGYADLGFAADLPLRFIPARFGKWTASAGLHLLWLGGNNSLLAGPPSDQALNGLNVTAGSGFQVWGLTGIKLEY
jgi:hypothetical protein